MHIGCSLNRGTHRAKSTNLRGAGNSYIGADTSYLLFMVGNAGKVGNDFQAIDLIYINVLKVPQVLCPTGL